MYSIQEILNKIPNNLKNIRETMDTEGSYHPENANIFQDQKPSVERELRESLRRISLNKLLEYLTRSGTTGVQGAAYLAAAKVSDTLYYAAKNEDLTSLISAQIVDGWKGAELKVNVEQNESFNSSNTATGGASPEATGVTEQTTLTPKLFTVNTKITKEMLDDQQYGLIEWKTKRAGMQLAQDVSDNLLKIVVDDSNVTSETAGSDETLLADIVDAFDAMGRYRFIGNTLIVTPEAWSHSLYGAEIAGGTAGDFWRGLDGVNGGAPAAGFDLKYGCLDVKFSTSPPLHLSTELLGTAFTDCHTILLDRYNAVLTGRKRWLQIDNYSDPIADLAGAVVSARANSVMLQPKAAVDIAES